MPEKNPTVARLRQLIAELESFGYEDLADEIRDDLSFWERTGGSSTGDEGMTHEEILKLASQTEWDPGGLDVLQRLGEDNDNEGSKE